LFNPAGGIASAAMADILSTLFGYGGLLVAAAIFLTGVIILLRKVGIVFRFSPERILAIEVLFLAVLGLLHIIGDATELRTLVRNGVGGGIIAFDYPVRSRDRSRVCGGAGCQPQAGS
jgi:hypothetical protein